MLPVFRLPHSTELAPSATSLNRETAPCRDTQLHPKYLEPRNPIIRKRPHEPVIRNPRGARADPVSRKSRPECRPEPPQAPPKSRYSRLRSASRLRKPLREPPGAFPKSAVPAAKSLFKTSGTVLLEFFRIGSASRKPASRRSPPPGYGYFIRNEKRLMFFNAMPVPRAMARSGSSAIWNGMPVFSFKRRSSPLMSAPPPAR